MISWQRPRSSGSGAACSHMPRLYGHECFRKGPSWRIFDGFSGIASLPPDAAQVDPVEEHHQVRRLDLHALGLRNRRRGWKAERALLQPLVAHRVPVAIPVQDLDPITTTTAENEQVPRQRIERQGRFDEVGERVEAFAHVGRLGTEEDPHGRGPAQHGRPSSTARMSPRVQGSNPVGTRTVGPPLSTISIGGAVRGGANSASTTRTGRKTWAADGSAGPLVDEFGRSPAVSRSRRFNSRRHQRKLQTFSPSLWQKARTASPLLS